MKQNYKLPVLRIKKFWKHKLQRTETLSSQSRNLEMQKRNDKSFLKRKTIVFTFASIVAASFFLLFDRRLGITAHNRQLPFVFR
jgi:hypothetical protein